MKRFVDDLDDVYVLEVTEVESAGVVSKQVYLYSANVKEHKKELEELCNETEWNVLTVVDNVEIFCKELDEEVIPNLLLKKKLYNQHKSGF